MRSVRPICRGPALEALEPRLLHAADGAGSAVSEAVAALASASAPPAVQAWVASASAQVATAPAELVVVDARVPDAQRLIAAFDAQREAGRPLQVRVVQAGDDAMAAIDAALGEPGSAWSAVHLIGHGEPGEIRLGATRIDVALLRARAAEVADWSARLAPGADLLIWGCDSGAGEAGAALLDALAALTGADVAASVDATGGLALGGDWVLEVSRGAVEAAAPIGAVLQADYGGLLGEPTSVVVTTVQQQPESDSTSTAARQIATGTSGTVTVWTETAGAGQDVYARFDASDGTPGTRTLIAGGGDIGRVSPGVAVDDAGNALVAWSQGTSIRVAYFAAPDVAGGAMQVIQAATRIDVFVLGGSSVRLDPSVAMSPDGRSAVVAWEWSDGTGHDIDLRRLSLTPGPGGSVTALGAAPTEVTYWQGQADRHADVAILDDGSGFLVFTSDLGQSVPQTYAVRFTATGAIAPGWQRDDTTGIRVSDSGAAAITPTIALDPSTGRALAVWIVDDGSTRTLEAVALDANGALGDRITLAASVTTALHPSVAFVGNGEFAVAWESALPGGAGRDIGLVRVTVGATGATTDDTVLRVNDATPGTQRAPSVDAAGGRVVVAWADDTIGAGGAAGLRWASFPTTASAILLSAPDILVHEALGDPGAKPVSVRLGSEPSAPVTVSFAILGSGGRVVGTPTLTFDATNWSTAQTVRIAAVEDGVAAGDRPFTVRATATSTDVAYGTLTADLAMTAVDGTPSVTATGPALGYTENDGAVAIDPGLVVADPDSTMLAGATVRITTNHVSGEDVLGFTDQSGITGAWDAATGTLSLSGWATPADYAAALRTVTYTNTSSLPSTSPRTVSFVVSDGTLTSGPATRPITVTAVDDTPVATDTSASGVEDDPSVAIVLSGSDLDGIVTAFRVTSLPGHGGLYLDPALTLAVAAGADLSASGGSTTLYFVPDANRNGSTTFEYVAIDDDGHTSATAAVGTLSLTAVNDAPTLDPAKSPALWPRAPDGAIPVGTVGTPVGALLVWADSPTGVRNVSDVDVNDAQGTARDTVDGAKRGLALLEVDTSHGTWWYTTDGGTHWSEVDDVSDTNALLLSGADTNRLYFMPDAGWTGTLTEAIEFRAWDGSTGTAGTYADASVGGGASAFSVASDTARITVEYPPVVTVTPTTLGYTENDGGVVVDAALTVSDPDHPQLTRASVRVAAGYVRGEDVLGFTDQLGISGSWNEVTGTLTLTGTVPQADYEAALRTVTYTNTSEAPGTATRRLGIQTFDGTMWSATASRYVSVTAVNDAPVAAQAGAIGDEDARAIAIVLSAGDVDDGVAALRLTSLPGHGTLYVDAGLSTAAALGADLAVSGGSTRLHFVPDANWNGTTGFGFEAVDRAGAVSGPAAATVNVTAVDDPPVVADADAAGDEDTRSIAISLPATDIDDGVAALRLTSLPGHGTLYLDAGLTTPVALGTDVAASNGPTTLHFVPDANWNGTTRFGFVAVDRAGAVSVAVATGTLNVAALNDAPTVVTATSASGPTDQALAVGPSQLRTTDVDNDAVDIVYRLETASAYATLRLGDRGLVPGDAFTQADVDAGRVGVVGLRDGVSTLTLSVQDARGAPASAARVTLRFELKLSTPGLGSTSAPASMQIGTQGLAVGDGGSMEAGAGSGEGGSAVASGSASVAAASARAAAAMAAAAAPAARAAGASSSQSDAEKAAMGFVRPASAAAGTLAVATSAAGGAAGAPFAAAALQGDAGTGGAEAGGRGFVSDLRSSGARADEARRGAEEAARRIGSAFAPQAGQAWSPAAALRSADYVAELRETREQAGEGLESRVLVASSVLLSTSLSIGYAVWMARGGVLLAGLLASMPAWRAIDPLPVLERTDARGRDDETEDDSLRGLLARAARGSVDAVPDDGPSDAVPAAPSRLVREAPA